MNFCGMNGTGFAARYINHVTMHTMTVGSDS